MNNCCNKNNQAVVTIADRTRVSAPITEGSTSGTTPQVFVANVQGLAADTLHRPRAAAPTTEGSTSGTTPHQRVANTLHRTGASAPTTEESTFGTTPQAFAADNQCAANTLHQVAAPTTEGITFGTTI